MNTEHVEITFNSGQVRQLVMHNNAEFMREFNRAVKQGVTWLTWEDFVINVQQVACVRLQRVITPKENQP